MSPLRVAIVGCGRISDLHALGYHNYDHAKIVAVCDKNKSVAYAKARMWNVDQVYQNFEEILALKNVDLVELITPHHLHAQMAIAACNAGKHVSVQKPMALTVTEADAMINAAENAGVNLRVYENFIFYPPIMKAKELIVNGEIGEPQMIRLHFSTGTRDSSWKIPLNSWLWRFDPKKCGGGPLVFDHGYHLFSVAHFLMGPVERVSAWIDETPIIVTKSVDGPATIMLKFKGKRKYGVMDFSHTPRLRINSPFYADDNRIEIIGEKGVILINRCTAKTIDLPPLLLYKDGLTTPIDIPNVNWDHSFINCTRHLIHAIENGTRPSLDGVTARAILQSTIAAHKSSIQKKEIIVEDVEV